MPQLLLDSALEGVRSRAASLREGQALQQAFLAWLLPSIEGKQDRSALTASVCAQLKSAGRTMQAAAALGFLIAAGENSLVATAAFAGGVQWMVGRNVVGSATSATTGHPLALLGVVAGTLAHGDEAEWKSLCDWYASFSDQIRTPLDAAASTWQLELAEFVRRRLALHYRDVPSATSPSVVALALARKDLMKLELAESTSTTASSSVLQALLQMSFADDEEAAFCLAAYDFLVATSEHPRLRAPELHDVALALTRLQAALRRWTWEEAPKVVGGVARKWHVDHEYHFQNLLTAIFTPLFSDLKDEEWLSSLGPKKPRADLVVPSLRLVIEVKYWRANVQASSMVSQIAEDVGLYRKKGSPYQHIVPIIWDDGARIEQHAHLVSGLNDLEGVVHPTIVSRPAAMADNSPDASAKKPRRPSPVRRRKETGGDR